MSAQHFAEIIETFQQTKGWKLQVVADILGVSTATIHRWKEHGVPTAKYVKANIGEKLRKHLVYA